MSPREQILGGGLEPLGPHEVGAYVNNNGNIEIPHHTAPTVQYRAEVMLNNPHNVSVYFKTRFVNENVKTGTNPYS